MAAELTAELRAWLLAQSDRSYYGVIRGLQVSVVGDTTVIHCASVADRMHVLDALMGALRAHVVELGLPVVIRVTDAAPPAEEAARVVDVRTCVV
jgi:hypothetical protein